MAIAENAAKGILNKITVILKTAKNPSSGLKEICLLLKKTVLHYDWVGFYLVDHNKPDELILGPYEGASTEHTRIKFGQGICGRAAATGKTFVVDDVSSESNYLSCSLHVKSEIVLPIFRGTRLVGELDIDSHTLAAFDNSDEIFLGRICEMVSGII